jgi:hypothetical protein
MRAADLVPVGIPTLSPLGERVSRDGVFTSRRGLGEEVKP